MEIYNLLERKFENILSGICLTSIREDNKKIISKYDIIDEGNYLKAKKDLTNYVKNYLFLKDFEILEISTHVIKAKKNEKIHEFLIELNCDFDDQEIKIKVIDDGIKTSFTEFEGQYMFLFSLKKAVFYLINVQNLKKQIKDNRENFKLLTEENKLLKNQYINFNLSQINQKIKIFSLK